MQRYIFALTDDRQQSYEECVHATAMPEAWTAIGRLMAYDEWNQLRITSIRFVTCAPI